jgi:hypothetical protein
MLQALTAPFLSSVLLGALALGLTATVPEPAPPETARRLMLHAGRQPHAIYITAWACGDVVANVREGALEPMRFTTRAWISDGCRWEGVETLVPIGPRTFAYDYRENILECAPDAVPAYKTPRKGFVTVERF